MKHLITIPFLLLALQACQTTVPNGNEGVATLQDPANTRAPIVQPGVGLHIVVMASNNKELDENPVMVNSDGQIALPLLGGINVAGKSILELEALLKERYSKYFVDTAVVISFVNDAKGVSPWGYVTVLGCVEDPGRVLLPAHGNLTISAAVQEAGGLADSAKSSNISVTRKNPQGKPEHFSVNLDAFAEGDMDEDRTLQAGDVVYVREKIW